MMIPDFKDLSPREIMALDAMIEYYDAQRVAQMLKISVKTVNTYLERAKDKAYLGGEGVTRRQLCHEYGHWRGEQCSARHES